MTRSIEERSFAKRITITLAALLTAATLSTALNTEAHAGSRERAFIGGLAAGIVGTAIIANENRRYRERTYYRESRWDRHVRRCYARYASYSERTDTWIDRRGRERRCRK